MRSHIQGDVTCIATAEAGGIKLSAVQRFQDIGVNGDVTPPIPLSRRVGTQGSVIRPRKRPSSDSIIN